MKNSNFLILFLSLSFLSLNAQVDSTRLELYKLAMEDGKVSKKELKMIDKILGNEYYYVGGSKKQLPKSLDPAYYINNGLQQGYKMILFRLQSRIIEDMDKGGRILIDGRPTLKK